MTGTPFEPIQITTSPLDPDTEVERVHVFSIDDEPYYMPAEIPPAVGLRYMDQVRARGEVAAQAFLLEAVLGVEAYQALINCDDITTEQLEAIGEEIGRRALGPLGRPGRAERRNSRGSSSTGTTSQRTSGRSTGSRSKTRTTS